MTRFHRIDAFFGRFYSAIGSLIGVVIGLFAVTISLDLVLRLAGIGNLPGLQEIIEYVLFASVFLGAPWVLYLGGHVRVDLIIESVPARIARGLGAVLDMLGLVVCAVLVWFGVVNLLDAYEYNALQMKYFNVPEWWLLSVVVIGFSLLTIEFLFRLIRGGAGAVEPDEGEAAL